MLAETFFYVSGSVFFSLSILILLVVFFSSLKFFQGLFALKAKIKMVAEDIASKTAAFSFGLASITSLLQKMINSRKKSKDKKK